MKMNAGKNELLRGIPKMDEMLNQLQEMGLMERASRDLVKSACRQVLDGWRLQSLAAGDSNKGRPVLPGGLAEAAAEAARLIEALRGGSLRPVVNATGVILHTNLGRAPLCEAALERIAKVGRGYSNLEYDLQKGERGERYDHVRDLLRLLTGAEDALVVNNNAAAVLLVLNSLAEGQEAIVSRGELIEIGGEFRIPEIMGKSGARLREVGATNRTRLADYERAISQDTAMIMKVHTSNYRIVGFTEETSLAELVALGKKHRIPVISDLGSGLLIDLAPFGLDHEPTIAEVMESGVDLVTFSGDKLLGGPQAGIIIGRGDLIERIKRNPLNRALRIDKMTIAALEATLTAYLQPEEALKRIRRLRALTEPVEQVRKRAARLLRLLRRVSPSGMTISLQKGFSFAGGGALPLQEIPTWLLAIQSGSLSANVLDRRLREEGLVARISGEKLLLDSRTLDDGELYLVRDALGKVLAEPGR
ncbi:MAG: L-seryl-tRNA(Sec) selenium transferase [Smithellaceae bacterium]|nr:L-seryl-tRNA(Sec) selenium transferase [Smithellaceae bacterium]